ncbi:hypothetical protein JCM8547_005805 [Rhodosporidiobolus lusitaniae]
MKRKDYKRKFVRTGHCRTTSSSCSPHRSTFISVYEAFRPLLERSKRPLPPAPPVKPLHGLGTLPLELKLQVLEHAVNDGDYLDLDTLRTVSEVNKEGWQLAAPKLWRVMDLDRIAWRDLERFGGVLSVLTLSLIRILRIRPFDSPSDISCTGLARFLGACRGLEALEIHVINPMGFNHWRWHNGLLAILPRLREYSLTLTRAVEDHAAGPLTADQLYNSIPSVLSSLTPSVLTKLSLKAPGRAFGWTISSFTRALSPFGNLTHLSLGGLQETTDFHLSELSTLHTRLQSLHLDFATHSLPASSLLWFLSTLSPTLQHLSLFCRLSEPVAPRLELSALRHLRLGIPNSHLILSSLSCPRLELLDLPLPVDTKPPLPVPILPHDYYAFIQSFPYLSIFLTTQKLVEIVPAGGLDAVIAECKAREVLVLWRMAGGRGAKDEVWVGKEELDSWVRQWRIDREKAQFLAADELQRRGMTAEYA